MCGRDLSLALALIERVQLLAEAHALTPAEQRLAYALLTRRPLVAIASDLHVTSGTAKDHASAVYHKFGVCNRLELIGVLLAVPVGRREAA